MKIISLFSGWRLLPLSAALFSVVYGATLFTGEDRVANEECYVNLNVASEPVRFVSADGKTYLQEYFTHDVIRLTEQLGYRPAAFYACEESFTAGDAGSGFWLAEYLYSRGDFEEAKRYYKKSAEMGDARSKYFLALLAIFGGNGSKSIYTKGVYNKDIAEVFDGLEGAAEEDFSKAQQVYAGLLRYTKVPKNKIHHLKWKYLHRAAENGDFKAMWNLAEYYLYMGNSGPCLPHPDMPEENLEYFRTAYSALNIVCDEKKGLHYLTEAARSGMAPLAILHLAQYYAARGDTEKAMYWHSLFWEWDYEDYFYARLYGDSPTFAEPPINYGYLCDQQHKSEAYLKQHSPSGGIIFDAETLVQEEARYQTYACQYKAHSWYYICGNKNNYASL